MMGKNIYLCEDNAEETLDDVIRLMKDKVASNSRRVAFDDCTNYWRERIEKVLVDDSPNGTKVSQIKEMLNITLEDKE